MKDYISMYSFSFQIFLLNFIKTKRFKYSFCFLTKITMKKIINAYIPEDQITQIDQLILSGTYRNKSHFVSEAIKEYLFMNGKKE